MKINGENYDLNRPIYNEASFELILKDNLKHLKPLIIFSHLMASVIKDYIQMHYLVLVQN